MPTNIEIKARASDWDNQYCQAARMASSQEELVQEDIFFNCPQGRLKLRILAEGSAYLVFYNRPDTQQAKASEYEMAPVSNAKVIGELLTLALGQTHRVRKRRTVFHFGQARIHFDEVESLGRFIELEVVLRPGQVDGEGHALVQALMARLGISEQCLIEGSYADLMMALNA